MHAPCHAISVVHSFRAEKRSIRRKTGMVFIGIILNVARIEDLEMEADLFVKNLLNQQILNRLFKIKFVSLTIRTI